MNTTQATLTCDKKFDNDDDAYDHAVKHHHCVVDEDHKEVFCHRWDH